MNKVIDLEVAAGAPSPTIDPSVRVVLVGHSMGGIVAAETAIELTSEHPIHGSTDPAVEDPKMDAKTKGTPDRSASPLHRPPTPNSLMFPYIQGVLAFDTPFLGISPGVVAHTAEGHYSAASAAVAQLSSLTSLWGAGAAKSQADGKAAASRKPPAGALPAPESQRDKDKKTPAEAGGWGNWGKIAMVAGAVGAVAAGGAAAYMNREHISQTVSWATSHLEFVGCLARREELRRRVAYMVRLNRDLGVGFGNFYTRLGRSATSKQVGMVGTVLGTDRTFCVVPQREKAGDWREAVNNKATDETTAHICEFFLLSLLLFLSRPLPVWLR